jgi:hypothetical protein
MFMGAVKEQRQLGVTLMLDAGEPTPLHLLATALLQPALAATILGARPKSLRLTAPCHCAAALVASGLPHSLN